MLAVKSRNSCVVQTCACMHTVKHRQRLMNNGVISVLAVEFDGGADPRRYVHCGPRDQALQCVARSRIISCLGIGRFTVVSSQVVSVILCCRSVVATKFNNGGTSFSMKVNFDYPYYVQFTVPPPLHPPRGRKKLTCLFTVS